MENNIVLAINKTKEDLAKIVNNCGLPVSVTAMIVKDIYEQCQVVATQELANAKKGAETETKEKAKEE